MKFRIVSPDGKEQVKDFDTYDDFIQYMSAKNDDIYRSDPMVERLNFRPEVIE